MQARLSTASSNRPTLSASARSKVKPQASHSYMTAFSLPVGVYGGSPNTGGSARREFRMPITDREKSEVDAASSPSHSSTGSG